MRRFALLCCGAVILGGCSWFNGLTMRSQSPDEPELEKSSTPLVGDWAVPTNMHSVRIEAVGLVTGLHNTGSDPAPSVQRAALVEEMHTRGVANPNTALASGDVSLVLVRGSLRPGVQEGDRFDVELRVPSHSETTSLRGGYLLDTRLTETAVLGNQLRRGNLLARARGPVMIDPTADPEKDRVLMCRGRILGGGVAIKSRPLGLVLTPDHQNVLNSSRVANAINKRFHMFRGGVKAGVAKAKDDQLIELQAHPRYKDSITRYVQVVRAVPVSESESERMRRIVTLRGKLLDSTTSADAALQLEAIGGEEAGDALLEGIQAKDPEVRFYAAEALAYLDRREAAEPLGQIVRDEPAFRVFALAALSTMQEYAACEQLRELLSSPSAETRYGAFRALWAMNKNDPFVKGTSFDGQFNYHVLDVSGPPMIHVTRSRIPEIVIFGPVQKLIAPLAVNAGNEIMVTSSGGDEISVSKFSVQEADQKRIVSTQVDDVIHAIVDLGGTYPDVVQALQEAKISGALVSRLEFDALPEAGRNYDRIAEDEQGTEKAGGDENAEGRQANTAPDRPLPELFAKRGEHDSRTDGYADADSEEGGETDADSDDEMNTKKGFFARILGR